MSRPVVKKKPVKSLVKLTRMLNKPVLVRDHRVIYCLSIPYNITLDQETHFMANEVNTEHMSMQFSSPRYTSSLRSCQPNRMLAWPLEMQS